MAGRRHKVGAGVGGKAGCSGSLSRHPLRSACMRCDTTFMTLAISGCFAWAGHEEQPLVRPGEQACRAVAADSLTLASTDWATRGETAGRAHPTPSLDSVRAARRPSASSEAELGQRRRTGCPARWGRRPWACRRPPQPCGQAARPTAATASPQVCEAIPMCGGWRGQSLASHAHPACSPCCLLCQACPPPPQHAPFPVPPVCSAAAARRQLPNLLREE